MENESNQKRCPKCGKGNPAATQFCSSCGCSLSQIPKMQKRLDVKISKLAITSLILALLSCLFLCVSFFGRTGRGDSRAVIVMWQITSLAAIILGIISLIQIGLSAGRLVAVGIAIIGTTLPSVVFLLIMLIAILKPPRSVAFRMGCGTNLSGIGKAMLIYANDYEDELPRSGGRNSVWAARIPQWDARNRFKAYGVGMDGTGGTGNISSCFYLLVKYAEVTPKSFICTGDVGIKEFKPNSYKAGDRDLIDLWDFGPEPQKHCSYSYHMPFGLYALTTSCDPGLAVAADRNPWMDSPFKKARNFQAFDPDGSRKAIKAGNAVTHKTDAQNVLFMDIHVGQQKNSFCGLNDDNIYTYWNGDDIRRGTPPRLGSKPADRMDSLLVNDPAIPR